MFHADFASLGSIDITPRMFSPQKSKGSTDQQPKVFTELGANHIDGTE